MPKQDSERELVLLSAIAEGGALNQRGLAKRAGGGLRLTNLLLRNLARKGFIRMTRLKPRRILYLITPEGITGKMRLTSTYVGRFLEEHRRIQKGLKAALAPLSENGSPRVALYGIGEAAELVRLCLEELDLEIVGVFDSEGIGKRFWGRPVESLGELLEVEYDWIVVSSHDFEPKVNELLRLGVPSENIITPFGDAFNPLQEYHQ